MLHIIRSMYTEVKSQVKHNNIISPVFFSNIGVPFSNLRPSFGKKDNAHNLELRSYVCPWFGVS